VVGFKAGSFITSAHMSFVTVAYDSWNRERGSTIHRFTYRLSCTSIAGSEEFTPTHGRTVCHLANSYLTRVCGRESARFVAISCFAQRTRRCFAHTSIATNRGLETVSHRSHFLRNEGGRSCKIHLVGYCEGGENCLVF